MLDQDIEPPAVSQVDSSRANSNNSPILSALIVSTGFLACWLVQILSPDNQNMAPELPTANLTLLILAVLCALYYNHKAKANRSIWSTSGCLTIFVFSSLLPFAALLLPLSLLHYAGSPTDNLYICALLCLVPAFNTLSLIGLRQQILSRETGMALCSSAAIIAAITVFLSNYSIAEGLSPIAWLSGAGRQNLVLSALCYGNLSGCLAALLIFNSYRGLPAPPKRSHLSLVCAILAALSFLCEFRSTAIARAEADLNQAPQQQSREQAVKILTMLAAAGDIQAALPARAVSFFTCLPADEQEKLHRLALFRLTGKLNSPSMRQKSNGKYIAANTPGYQGKAADLSLESS